MKILLAEDNDNLREVITDYLSDQGYEVIAKENGLKAWEVFQEEQFQLVLLDVMMPQMDGFELCKKIRSLEDVPILFLTARVQEQDQLKGYALGADDYIVKPFSLPVLYAKCKAILERTAGKVVHENQMSIGEIFVDLNTHKVMCEGKEIKLQALDFELLAYFMQNSGRTLTREQILNRVWGYEYEGSDRSVDTHVKRLRKALGKYGIYLQTVIKAGYKFEKKEI